VAFDGYRNPPDYLEANFVLSRRSEEEQLRKKCEDQLRFKDIAPVAIGNEVVVNAGSR